MIARLALALALLMPLADMAQSLPTLAPETPSTQTPLVDELLGLQRSPQRQPQMLAQGAPVLPIWSGSSGQLLAVVALPSALGNSPIDATPAYNGPSAWQLAGSSAASAAGLRWQMGDGFHADAMFGQYRTAASLGCTSAHCTTASASNWSRSALTGVLGMGWTNADGGLDLSYGLSWLQSQSSSPLLGEFPAVNASVPVLTLPGMQAYSIDDEAALYARGRWQFSEGSAVDLSASYGRGRMSPIGVANAFAPGVDLDQLSLSLGLDAGSLRGAIVGHVLRSDDPVFAGKRWTTLDLGVSWRTPWSGELSVGAQNVLNAPLNSARDAEASQARTPYIQYRQDL
jgi:hypothetical protein